jgi:hypothetical protein
MGLKPHPLPIIIVDSPKERGDRAEVFVCGLHQQASPQSLA